ncbi:hypothetical protein JCM8097_000112 [Rhodosporidiobolus ruineniae]
MPPTPSGACCVCGKETTQRCGACGKAGFDLFFCSREHQKLVWFAHKLVCGPKSAPFTCPSLTAEERTEVLTHLHDKDSYGRAETTLAEHFQLDQSDHRPLAEKLDALEQQPKTPFDTVLQWSSLNRIRVTLHCLRFPALATVPPEGPYSYPPQAVTPLILLASASADYAYARVPPDSPHFPHRLPELGYPREQGWYIKLFHHVVIFAALNYLEAQRTHDQENHPFDGAPLSTEDARHRADLLAPVISVLRSILGRQRALSEEAGAVIEALEGLAAKAGMWIDW